MKDRDPISSNTTQGDHSKYDDSSNRDPDGNEPRHTEDSTSDRDLISVLMHGECEGLDEAYMVNEDREFCELFFGEETK